MDCKKKKDEIKLFFEKKLITSIEHITISIPKKRNRNQLLILDCA